MVLIAHIAYNIGSTIGALIGLYSGIATGLLVEEFKEAVYKSKMKNLSKIEDNGIMAHLSDTLLEQ
ncbi:MAG: hypothetical protein DRJ38_09460 [Thermoprotei archaeon]|nr:MAG: hypothetical protein DRJ38_09460 [Thermoprotei archaeon]